MTFNNLTFEQKKDFIKNALPINLIGKTYQLLSILDTVIHEFKINFVKIEFTKPQTREDGSFSNSTKRILVSNDNTSFYSINPDSSNNII